LANITEKIFKDDEIYNQVTTAMSNMRVALSQTDSAHLIPVKQRKKSHYQNIKTISDYLIVFLRCVKEKRFEIELTHRKKQLEWVIQYESFINNFSELNIVISQIEKILKTEGLSKKTIKASLIIINMHGNNPYIDRLKEGLKKYLKNILINFPKEKLLLCTSDVIESAFGKYKNFTSQNPMAGVTNLVLCLAAFTHPLTRESIISALETVKVKDIKNWNSGNVENSVYKKRQIYFSTTEKWNELYNENSD